MSGIEQVSLCVRYVELNTLVLHEDFLQFVPAVDMTGKELAKLIIDNLQHFGIDTVVKNLYENVHIYVVRGMTGRLLCRVNLMAFKHILKRHTL